MDLTDTIVPKSDQLNAEDLLSGPRTVTITDVRKGSAEQPVDIHLAEFPGRPFKPSKTVRRILVAAWGPDASTYAGRRMTLYRDAAVRFGGMDVGGIRVSELSHITKPLTLVLAVSKGKRAPYVIKPLPDTPAPAQQTAGITDAQMKELGPLLKDAGLSDRGQTLAYVSSVIDRTVQSSKELTNAEAAKVIDQLKLDTAGEPPVPEPAEPTLDGWPATAEIPS